MRALKMRAPSLLCLVTGNESYHKIYVTAGLILWQLLYIKTIFEEALVEINFSLLPVWYWQEWVVGNCCILIDLNSTLERHPA